MTKLRFGVGIPTGTEGLMYPVPFADVRDNIDLALFAEKLGYDSVWGNDHITTQQYVYDEFGQSPNYYSPLLTLAAIAEKTTTLKVATALLVLPFRNPVVVAKELATLDKLAQGRIMIGVGIGAYREEFVSMFGNQAQGMNRGEILDESLEMITKIFREDNVTMKGKYFEIQNVQSYPKPTHNPFPFYIGGNNPKGRERVAKYGTGWLPTGFTPEEIAVGLEDIKTRCEVLGRDYTTIDVAPQFSVCLGRTMEEAKGLYEKSQMYKHLVSLQDSTMKGLDLGAYEERDLIGTPESVCEQIRAYAKAGVTSFPALLFTGNTLEEMKDQMVIFSREVMSQF